MSDSKNIIVNYALYLSKSHPMLDRYEPCALPGNPAKQVYEHTIRQRPCIALLRYEGATIFTINLGSDLVAINHDRLYG